MDDIDAIVREALRQHGRLPSEDTSQDDPDATQQVDPVETEKLVIQCVLEIVQMPCYNVKQLAAIRRTLRNVLKALVKEREYVTIGVIKRYVDPRNRYLVKSILARAIDNELVISTTIEDTVIYQINHVHANDIFTYLERVK